jgi:hypothetical protein
MHEAELRGLLRSCLSLDGKFNSVTMGSLITVWSLIFSDF